MDLSDRQYREVLPDFDSSAPYGPHPEWKQPDPEAALPALTIDSLFLNHAPGANGALLAAWDGQIVHQRNSNVALSFAALPAAHNGPEAG